ncbi:PREDICTED: activating transcription factor 7-interacting protein 2 [Dipodomys ordii]|uniref:Activating transcription factor 7-interacting protein 2 n=1 Tax=Dipodomys ordii TaxID=10020 RepID=A0A1S3ETB6_DIPOR|nr:PREDICTED: activating transcription factor 7-interacting protein 2 [Dipodomys ordii]
MAFLCRSRGSNSGPYRSPGSVGASQACFSSHALGPSDSRLRSPGRRAGRRTTPGRRSARLDPRRRLRGEKSSPAAAARPAVGFHLAPLPALSARGLLIGCAAASSRCHWPRACGGRGQREIHPRRPERGASFCPAEELDPPRDWAPTPKTPPRTVSPPGDPAARSPPRGPPRAAPHPEPPPTGPTPETPANGSPPPRPWPAVGVLSGRRRSIRGHNQKKRMFSENKENVKRMKTSEPINGNNCVALDKQTAILELVRHVIRQEVHSIDYKLFDSKLNELNDRIGKTQCKSKHEALAVQLFEKISRLKRRIKTVLHQINCLEPETLSSNTAHETSKAETMTLGENQKSVDNPNERKTSVNCAPVKASRKMNSSPDCVEFVPKSNDDVMLISVESPNVTTPVTSDPTDIRKITSNNSSNSSNDEIQVRAVRKRKLGFVIDLTSEDLFNSNTEAPLPLPELADKSRDTLPPQKAELKVKWVLKPLGIALTWNISKINPKCAPVESYHLFLCHENANSQLIWKKIGEIKALPLPMACTLSQFLVSNKYYFTVQSKDIFGRYGPFCDIKCIPGLSKTLKSL